MGKDDLRECGLSETDYTVAQIPGIGVTCPKRSTSSTGWRRMSLMLTSHKSPWGAGLVVLPHLRDLEALETRRELLVGARRPGRRGSHALLPGTEQMLGEEP